MHQVYLQKKFLIVKFYIPTRLIISILQHVYVMYGFNVTTLHFFDLSRYVVICINNYNYENV